MKRLTPTRRTFISPLIFGVLLIGGCVISSGIDPGNVQTNEQTIELGQATSVNATIDARTGAVVTIRDGASSLLNAKLRYNEMLKPDVTYAVDGSAGTLDISQPASENLKSRDLDNVWDLQFGADAPIDLKTNVTSGDTKIDLSTLRLSSLKSGASSGNVAASIGGNQEALTSIDLSTTSGSVGLDLSGSFPELQTLSLGDSSGKISLVTSGSFQALSSLQIKDTSGSITIVLGGSWGNDLSSTIRTSSGSVSIKLPNDVGVRVTASVSSGNITANGLHLADGAYVNDAYGTSPVTLTFDIKVSSGNITLSVGG